MNVHNIYCSSATIESKMREIFGIETSAETRLWNKYTSNTYEQLSKPDVSVQVGRRSVSFYCRKVLDLKMVRILVYWTTHSAARPACKVQLWNSVLLLNSRIKTSPLYKSLALSSCCEPTVTQHGITIIIRSVHGTLAPISIVAFHILLTWKITIHSTITLEWVYHQTTEFFSYFFHHHGSAVVTSKHSPKARPLQK